MKKIGVYSLFLFGIMGLFSSCKETAIEEGLRTLKIDTEADATELTLDDYADYTLIPLETLDSVLIGHVSDILLKDDVLAVSTSEDKIILFDLNGKYLGEVSHKGDGPEEYNYIGNFKFTNEGDIMIMDQHVGAKVYNRKNQFIRSLSCKGYDFTILGNDLYTYSARDAKKGRITVYNQENGDSLCAFSTIDPYPTIDIAIPFKPLTDTESYYIPAFSDTIFAVKDRAQTPMFVLDFGSKNAKPETLNMENGMMDFFPKLMESNVVVSIEMFNKGDQYVWLNTMQFDGEVNGSEMNVLPVTKCFCINPDGKSIRFDKLVMKKYQNFTYEPTRLISSDASHFACSLQASELQDFAETLDEDSRKAFMEQLGLTNEDQNPYILLVKSK